MAYSVDTGTKKGHLHSGMSKVKKALIPAAGLGTRFLPASKTVPKELFPLVDRPLILHIVEEAVDAGIEDIILVAGRGKSAIDDFFDRSYELEDTLAKSGKTELLSKITKIKSLANIISIRQKEALGLGHAVLTGKPIIGNEPFAVLLGDEITFGKPNVTKQLVEGFAVNKASTVAIMEVPDSDVSKYGIVDVTQKSASMFQVHRVIEKPSKTEAPSRWALPGRYVFDSKLLTILQTTKPGKNGEIQLTDGMNVLAEEGLLFASTFTAKRYDAGDKFGFLQANIEIGLQHPEVGEKLRAYLKSLAKEL